MAEVVTFDGIEKDVVGIVVVEGKVEQVGGIVANFKAPGIGWRERIRCWMSRETCPAVVGSTRTVCGASNILEHTSSSGVPGSMSLHWGTYCGQRTEAAEYERLVPQKILDKVPSREKPS